MTKYIFITGGVVSSLGKGIVAASLGKLLRARGFSVAIQKFDPYINVDPGTMSPFQHGEVFVTDDGAETDLDLGHYERFTNTSLHQINNVTSGSVYQTVIQKERKGEYLGATVQVIPHITNEIKARLQMATKHFKPDFLIAEIGGTIGDIESLPFIEAIRQFRLEEGIGNSISIHVTLLPYLQTSGELKTKPSQHSVYVLRSYGIQPEVLVCRTAIPIHKAEKEKIALFCSVQKDCVFECKDMKSIYEVPLALEAQNMAGVVLKLLNIKDKKPNLASWEKLVDKIKHPKNTLTVALAGKYTDLSDAYISVVESLKHAGLEFDSKVNIKWLATEECTDLNKAKEFLSDVDALVVPGGFGVRGIEGKLNVINSTEFDENTKYPVIDLMTEQKNVAGYGGTMRLGAYPCHLKEGSKVHKAYGTKIISERHRHRYEVNSEYKKLIEDKGLIISGSSPDGLLAEVVEYSKNDWFVACQFHPEFKSRPESAHPLFRGLIKAAVNRKK